jgi:hypothetical protein
MTESALTAMRTGVQRQVVHGLCEVELEGRNLCDFGCRPVACSSNQLPPSHDLF